MVIIYTSSRRAVLRRFAALLIAPQRFVCYFATCRYATPHRPPHRSSVRLNDLFFTACRPAPHRSPPRCVATLRGSTQRFVCHNAAIRPAWLLLSTWRIASLLNDLFVTSLLGALHRTAVPRYASLLNATICLLRRYAAYGIAALFGSPSRLAPLLNSTICLLLRSATLLASPRRHAPLRSAAQRFVCHNATIRPAMQLVWPRRAAAHLNSTICLLQRRLASSQLDACRLAASLCNAPLHFALQRNATN